RCALDREVLDDRDGVAVLKAVAVRIEHDEPFPACVVRFTVGLRGLRPFVRAFRADVERPVLVHERGLAFRAGRYLTHRIRLQQICGGAQRVAFRARFGSLAVCVGRGGRRMLPAALTAATTELSSWRSAEMTEQRAELRREIHASASSITRQMYAALLGQMAVLLGLAYFFATHIR